MYCRRISTGCAPITSIEPRLRIRGESTSRLGPRSSAYAEATDSPSWPSERNRPPMTLLWRYRAVSRSSSVRVSRRKRYISSRCARASPAGIGGGSRGGAARDAMTEIVVGVELGGAGGGKQARPTGVGGEQPRGRPGGTQG